MQSLPAHQDHHWLLENGRREIELLLRAIIYQTAAPILIADDERTNCDATTGAAKLLGQAREKIIGRKVDEFAAPDFQPKIPELWTEFLQNGQQEGTLKLTTADGGKREVEYTAKGNVLPVRHLLLLQDKALKPQNASGPAMEQFHTPPRVQDYGLLLIDANGYVADWYSGAERIFGYTRAEVIGRDLAFLYPGFQEGDTGLNSRSGKS